MCVHDYPSLPILLLLLIIITTSLNGKDELKEGVIRSQEAPGHSYVSNIHAYLCVLYVGGDGGRVRRVLRSLTVTNQFTSF